MIPGFVSRPRYDAPHRRTGMGGRVALGLVGVAVLGVSVLGQQGTHLNPMIDLLSAKKAIFGLGVPTAGGGGRGGNRGGSGAGAATAPTPAPPPPKTPADLAADAA